MKVFFRASWAPLIASLSLSCGSAGSPSAGSNEQARSVAAPIIGGYLDTNTHGVVALALRGHNQVEVFCSGSLLAPNLVLTARHCIAQLGDGSSETVDCGVTQFTAQYDAKKIFVSTNAQPQTSNGTLYAVQEIRQAPGSNDVCGYDVALLILGSNVSSAVATPIEPALGITTKAKTRFSAVGYGLQDPNDTQGTTAGSRMRFDSSNVYCVGSACSVSLAVFKDEFVGNSPVCSGDSGGPALDSAGRVFGVTSRGDTNCTYALYSNVANWAAFIRSTGQDAATAGGYQPAAWVTSTAGDGAADDGGAGTGTGTGTETGSAGTTGDAPPPIQSATPTVSPLGTACQSVDDCPGTYKCYASTSKPPGICVPPCSSTAACPDGYQCSDALSVCTPAPDTVVKSHVSASCALSTQPQNGSGALAAALLVGCAFLARRRRNAP